MQKIIPINYAAALRGGTGIQAVHNQQETAISDAEKIHLWLQGIKTEVSLLLQEKTSLQNKLDDLKKLQASGYKDRNASQLLKHSDRETLLNMINNLETKEQQQLEMINECLSLSDLMKELNEEIKEKESLIFKGAAALAEMNRQYCALEKSSANISFFLSDAIFKQLNGHIAGKLKNKPIEYASNTDAKEQSERLWMHYVDFTRRLSQKKTKSAEKVIVKMRSVIERLITCDNFERLMPSLKEYVSETQYLQEFARYQSFKDEFIEKSIELLNCMLQIFSSEKIDATHQISSQSPESMLKFFRVTLKKLQTSDTSHLEKFQLVTAGAQGWIEAAFQHDPGLRKRQDVSLTLFKIILLERQKNIDHQTEQMEALELLKLFVGTETVAYEEIQTNLKSLRANSKRMKQKLKKQLNEFANETDKEITRVWLSLDDCKTKIATLLNNKLVRREDNERGLFTAEAMNGALNRHLMTEMQLQARLNKNQRLCAASSYKDEVALLQAVQTTVIPNFRQADYFREHLHLQHATPIEGWSLIKQESGSPVKKPITHSNVSFAQTDSGWPLIAHIYPCAD